MRIEAKTASVLYVSENTNDNILRNTIMGYAAVIGGADSIEILRHDHRRSEDAERAYRLARNISHILQEEAMLGRTNDPMGGSKHLDVATRWYAQRALSDPKGTAEELILKGRLTWQSAPIYVPSDSSRVNQVFQKIHLLNFMCLTTHLVRA